MISSWSEVLKKGRSCVYKLPSLARSNILRRLCKSAWRQHDNWIIHMWLKFHIAERSTEIYRLHPALIFKLFVKFNALRWCSTTTTPEVRNRFAISKSNHSKDWSLIETCIATQSKNSFNLHFSNFLRIPFFYNQ